MGERLVYSTRLHDGRYIVKCIAVSQDEEDEDDS